MKIKLLILFFAVILIVSCEPDEDSKSRQFPFASEQDIDSDELIKAYENAEDIVGLKSLLVSRNGVLVSEEYFTEMGADDLFETRSVTKSIVSALIGIAIEEGFLTSTNQKLKEFLTPLGYTLEDEKANITIEHLLTMSAGFEWNEFESGYSYRDWVIDDDQIEYCINGILENDPGEEFGYSSEEAHLLSVVLTEATGMSTHDFAFEYLFEPLGMSIEDFSWGEFPQGYFNGGADLSLKPKDMIKIGNLFLNNGSYNGNEIVSSNWIQESTNAHISTNLGGYVPDYGYLWWMNRSGADNYYFANGYGGQLIGIFPDLELVIVTTSEWQLSTNDAGQQWYNVMSLVMNDVLSSVN